MSRADGFLIWLMERPLAAKINPREPMTMTNSNDPRRFIKTEVATALAIASGKILAAGSLSGVSGTVLEGRVQPVSVAKQSAANNASRAAVVMVGHQRISALSQAVLLHAAHLVNHSHVH